MAKLEPFSSDPHQPGRSPPPEESFRLRPSHLGRFDGVVADDAFDVKRLLSVRGRPVT